MNEQINNTFIPTEGLVGKWDLDGNTIDTSGNGNDGTATNVTWGVSEKGYVSEVAEGNGNSSSVKLFNPYTSLGSNPNFSISLTFLYKTGNNDNDRIFGNYNASLEFFDLVFFGNGVTLNSRDSNSSRIDQTLSYTFTDGFYYNIITERGNGRLKIYINNEIFLDITDIRTGDFDSGGDLTLMSAYSTGNEANTNIGIVRFYNRVLTQQERTALHQEGQRDLGPLVYTPSTTTSHTFKKYGLPELNRGKVLKYSSPAVGGVYYDQIGNGNNGTATNVVDSSVGAYNIMTLTNGSITWSSTTFQTSAVWEKISGSWTLVFNPSYITSTGISGQTKELINIMLFDEVLTEDKKQQLLYSNFIPNN